MSKRIDINADVGEGIGNEVFLMPYLSSCNIACGGHAGNATTISNTIALALKHRVKIGAHPSYPDQDNFGRKTIKISATQLHDTLVKQLQLFLQIAKKQEATMHHVKLHGALYNDAAKDAAIAQTVVKALNSVSGNVKLYTLPNGELAKAGAPFFEIVPEGFIDRTYTANLQLLSRSKANALITDPNKAWQQLQLMVENCSVIDNENTLQKLDVHTYCIHGDQPGAPAILKYIAKKCTQHNIVIQ